MCTAKLVLDSFGNSLGRSYFTASTGRFSLHQLHSLVLRSKLLMIPCTMASSWRMLNSCEGGGSRFRVMGRERIDTWSVARRGGQSRTGARVFWEASAFAIRFS